MDHSEFILLHVCEQESAVRDILPDDTNGP